MLNSIVLLLASSLQIGPFFEQKDDDYVAVRPFYSQEAETVDVLWPLFTYHRDWWRFCYVLSCHDIASSNDAWQFDLFPLFFAGKSRMDETYWGLFPVYGHHPNLLLMYDVDFVLWPLWMHYKMPRPSNNSWLDTNTFLFPFFSFRSDGSWSFWPFYGCNEQRESTHRYAFWPLVTWAGYREDRDTAGAGYSWMAFPLWGEIRREREYQTMMLPPLFSVATVKTRGEAQDGVRIRAPWPFFEYEKSARRSRFSVWPLYERIEDYAYSRSGDSRLTYRFGWKLVELYDDETRVFPFWASGNGYFRLWPFWESETDMEGIVHGRFLSLVPIRWISQIHRNWSKFWTFYESERGKTETCHSLFWGIIRWKSQR